MEWSEVEGEEDEDEVESSDDGAGGVPVTPDMSEVNRRLGADLEATPRASGR